jgi:hypothetical protein
MINFLKKLIGFCNKKITALLKGFDLDNISAIIT